MSHARTAIFLLLAAMLATPFAASRIGVYAPIGPPSGYYTLSPIPTAVQEGTSVNLLLSVTGGMVGVHYQFQFHVKDPALDVWNSSLQDITPTYSSFSVQLTYPGSSFPGNTTLVGQYFAWVNQTMPIFTSISNGVANTHFQVMLTDKGEYQRTQTVSIQGAGYDSGDSVLVNIARASAPFTLVFSQYVPASSSGLVTTSWYIPKNETIDSYTVSLTGTSTPAKSPPDTETFVVSVATMSIASLSSSSASYQRLQTMQFSFRALYPSTEIATTLTSASITLTPPSGKAVILPVQSFDSVAQTFDANYTTLKDNQTGTWTASLRANTYVDGYGNYGPGVAVSTSPSLQPATLSVTISTSSSIQVGQPVRLNATILYPDETPLSSGRVSAFFIYTAGGHNDSIPIAYDSTLQLWIGSYTPQASEPGGLWSITVTASDSPISPPNSGSASRVVTLQGGSAPSSSLPLYWFAIIAALIAAAILGFFIAFRRRKVTHARLKIDLEAVKSEADRIEDNDFFKSVKDQLNKDKKET